MNFKKTPIAATLLVATLLSFGGCGQEEDPAMPTPAAPASIKVNNITVNNSGAEIIWDVTIKNSHEHANTSIVPFNDASNSLRGLVMYCNSALESNGQTRYCNDISKVICIRTSIAATESYYDCSYEIDGVRYAPGNRQIIMKTQTVDASGDDLLYTVGSNFSDDNGFYVKSVESNTSLMFNAYTSEAN